MADHELRIGADCRKCGRRNIEHANGQCPPGASIGPVLINGQTYQRPVIKVAVITLDGTSCTVPVGALLDVIEEGGPYTVQIKTMAQRDFDRMPEFEGW